MKLNFKTFTTAALFGVLALSTAYAATPETAEIKEAQIMADSEKVTATVQSVDYNTRKISLMMPDGEVENIVAGDEVKNLNQIKKGDTVTATYNAELVYNINKGGKASPPVVTATGSSARPGSKPAANVSRQVTTTVLISAIDRKEPSVTFKSANGETKKFKVRHPERLNGVNVGDAVDLTYSEALAVKVEKKSKM